MEADWYTFTIDRAEDAGGESAQPSASLPNPASGARHTGYREAFVGVCAGQLRDVSGPKRT